MDKLSAGQAGVQFEGMLFAQVLDPLGQSLGQFGSFAIAPLAQSIAAHDADGFAAVLASLFEKRDAK